MIDRIYSLLGLARRAGKITSGESQVEAMLKKRKGHLLILAEDAQGTHKKYQQWAEDLRLPVMIIGTKLELGVAIGLSPRSTVLVMDVGFAKAILKIRS
ncbi:ribosomal protein HS6-type (S12/L30/L7a) [Desulfitobacterium dichloroeliminans LMG P-21439]|uniref:Ribosomal protein HS6-type (S12/L30/L7a) n=1 Tax=Desulfitobacterium dichloroeliminans (strain LMG P-21439 / DCA1) TaxID=871963 RepID=L0F9Y2_DESDL|nr:L7Ae/L30e/S12e/Gadd45 family protein [Desulfitobacterium dichloroeliminans]AGA69997.1 ribosomal protein HS6-type (S12/L30/L7a) [Desulfitobacterium dichloroeliminans LMG P-21439]